MSFSLGHPSNPHCDPPHPDVPVAALEQNPPQHHHWQQYQHTQKSFAQSTKDRAQASEYQSSHAAVVTVSENSRIELPFEGSI